jgi:serine/threonine-protein kinase
MLFAETASLATGWFAMTPERWEQIEHLYHAALEQPSEARAAWLAEACGDDSALRHELESLIAHEDAAVLIDQPLDVAAAAVLSDAPRLEPGTSVGPYRISALLGEGGMGQVYRAHDAKLQRDVALKILPDAFVHDPDRLARFTREAHMLASLNHPNIAGIHGFEDSGQVHALVLELVEGPTLADRIARGPLPVDEALAIARQIADALEAAHEHGIVHRDLKPANIKVREDGTVKVLDFGLAKPAGPPHAAPNASDPTGPHGLNVPTTVSPTMVSPAITAIGVILGTAAYLSPEQAKGKPADKRSDIWAFGCVLFEMLAAKRAFDGEDVSDTLAAIIKGEPDWSALPPSTYPPVVTMLRACLIGDRRRRISDIATVMYVLDHYADAATPPGAAAGTPALRRLLRTAAAAGVALVVISAVVGYAVWTLKPSPTLHVTRFGIATSAANALTLSGIDRDVAITPDGLRIVYGGNNQLLVRPLEQLEPTVLTSFGSPSGVGNPRSIFISPDGQWVGFFTGPAMQKVPITGGPAVRITATDGQPRGATWGPDGTIIFATFEPGTGLQRVSDGGDEPTVLTKPDRERGERDHWWPEFLPGGDAVLFTITSGAGGIENHEIAVLDLRTGKWKVLIRGGSHARYVATGHLIYGVTGTLRAVAFDLKRLKVTSTPVPVLEGVVTTPQGAANAMVAANGSLVYVPSGARGASQRTVVSVDRQGTPSRLPGLPPDSYRDVRVSPDGARLALATSTDVWIYDAARATRNRLTTNPAQNRSPLWTPDGQRIIFTSTRAGHPELFWRPADGTGQDERLFARSREFLDVLASGWSADGKQLLFSEASPKGPHAIAQMAIEQPSEGKVLVKNESSASFPTVSADGRWMAYMSNVSGQWEIYVERYPQLGSRQPISTDGGQRPLWSRDGRELFFLSLDGRQMLAVPMQSGSTLKAGLPQVLFEAAISVQGVGARPYDVAPDGRFLIMRDVQTEGGGGTPSNIIVVLNWLEELKRLVPTN